MKGVWHLKTICTLKGRFWFLVSSKPTEVNESLEYAEWALNQQNQAQVRLLLASGECFLACPGSGLVGWDQLKMWWVESRFRRSVRTKATLIENYGCKVDRCRYSSLTHSCSFSWVFLFYYTKCFIVWDELLRKRLRCYQSTWGSWLCIHL